MAAVNETAKEGGDNDKQQVVSAPTISLPKGGGAIRGIGEKFGVNPVTGTGSMTIPIATSPGRAGFGPTLSLSYDSGAGNGPFGLGWNLSLPSITRKTDKGIPRYQDADESDVFILSGAEDLVPALVEDAEHPGQWKPESFVKPKYAPDYQIDRYRPRVESAFSRIERWKHLKSGETYWRSITRTNITTIYGNTPESRIADPNNPLHVFSWLISESYDDKGNAMMFTYVSEDSAEIDPNHTEVYEKNRHDPKDLEDKIRKTNRYIKCIKYGNEISRLVEPDLSKQKWFFEVVFDYDEGYCQALRNDPEGREQVRATYNKSKSWSVRKDPFSSYRSGFEIRTYRLCHRVLMFHHFPEELGTENCLVRSTEFTYQETKIASFITSVTQSSYKYQSGDNYWKKSLPPLAFEYSEAHIQSKIQTIDLDSLANLPIGLDGSRYQWVDLDGEGIAGILTEQAGTWFYKTNLGNGQFGAMEAVVHKPSLANLTASRQQLLDLAGDGQLDLTLLEAPTPGFYERTTKQSWEQFKPFESLPNINWSDPNLRFIDLTGDGHADVLITEDQVFVWYPSAAEAGFEPNERVVQALDEEQGPRLVFADINQTIYLADMSGDGLTDLVRINNGEICYWPNLGYGRFGSKVTMGQAPRFDQASDLFQARRLRLADIDGSGTTDIIYLGSEGIDVYRNQSGNSWSTPERLSHFPWLDDLSSVMAVDLLGNGTACLVWSTPLPAASNQPLCYIDLMGGQKPHLLTKVVNNLGAETKLAYAASTKFYLQDKRAGKPWVTKLPFPVHCVERMTVIDHWRKTTFSSTYSYHHGYFDGVEREFRGFGRVEQIDVEDYGKFATDNKESPYISDDETLYQPPVKTISWYHTGAFIDRERIIDQFKHEYFSEWFVVQHPDQKVQEHELPDPDLSILELNSDEWREALRACKGMLLRQEIYELDVDDLVKGLQTRVKLFSTAYHNCHVHLVQPRFDNKHAVFHVTESEAITYHYELNFRAEKLTLDPRIAHTLNLKIDEYGNVLQSIAAVYPRRLQHIDATLKNGAQELIQHVQSRLHLAYTESHYTEDVLEEVHDYRLRMPCEVMTFELTGLKPKADYFSLQELREYKLSDRYPITGQTTGKAVTDIPYQQLPDLTKSQKRLVEHTCSLFFDTSLDKPLALGKLNALGLPYESYKLALTDDILTTVFKDKITPDVQTLLADQKSSGYLSGTELAKRFGGTNSRPGEYWMCTGIAGFNADAAQHYFLPEKYIDPFGNETLLNYDSRDLYIQSSTDPVHNRTEATQFDFRVLAPWQLKDSNDNLSEMRFDILGLPIAMAVMGKGDEADNLNAFNDAVLNPGLATQQAFFVSQDYDAATAKNLLSTASTRFLYYFGEVIENDQTIWGRHPACACSIVRERHVADLPDSPVQSAFEYSDGSGNVLVKKVQAEPEQANGPLRWVASGKTILNNKGKPVKQYEPYFSPVPVGHRFEEPVEIGVTPIIYYDAVGRVVRTEAPDGSYSRVEFSPWHVTSYDANDTLEEEGNSWYAHNNASSTALDANKRAARLAVEHANTPAMTILDSLGREVISIAHNLTSTAAAPVDEKYVTFTKLDAEGKPLWVQDARGNFVMQYITPPLPDGTRPFNDAHNLTPQDSNAPNPNHPITQNYAPCYDIAGNLLFQHSMDAGNRWMLNDAAGKPIFAWNSRGFKTWLTYDELHRPTGAFVAGVDPTSELQFERWVYGESLGSNATQENYRGRLYQHYDTAGLVTIESYDFKGNPLRTKREFTKDYKYTPSWARMPKPMLASEQFIASTRYDALNRPIQIIAPHDKLATSVRINIIQPTYNEAGLLERVDSWLNQTAEPMTLLASNTATQHIVANIDYNAKGQRELIAYGNGVVTKYEYDKFTFRLIHLLTQRGNEALQNLLYTYDPMGNITEIIDNAQDSVFHSQETVLPSAKYRYDALYRLIAASGREHKGNGQQRDWDDSAYRVNALPNDGQALQNYVESYRYDAVGNILQMGHYLGNDADADLERNGSPIWNRRYQYALDSNRLLGTSLPGDAVNLSAYVDTSTYTAKYTYDAHGNMTSMSHLPLMQWDFKDQLQATSQQVNNSGIPETTYYVYDASGQRVRKITERSVTGGHIPTRMQERIYLGNFEIYSEYENDGDTKTLERESLHIMDDKQRVALIETQTLKEKVPITNLQPLVRYQLGNHLGSVCLELDADAIVITYEEYTPYGSTAYQAGRSAAEVSLKRYRYTGKERDKESGFSYHGARYYALWLGRWVSCDPEGMMDGTDIYAYARNNPVRFNDSTGRMTPQQELEIRKEQQKMKGELTPDQIGDVYKHPEDIPKNFGKPHPTVDTVIQQKRRLNQGNAQRAQTKPPPIVTKDEKFEAAKAGARNWLLDKAAEGIGQAAGIGQVVGLGLPGGDYLMHSLLAPLRAKEPAKFPTSLSEYEKKENYEAMQTTLTVTQMSLALVAPMIAESALANAAAPSAGGITSEAVAEGELESNVSASLPEAKTGAAAVEEAGGVDRPTFLNRGDPAPGNVRGTLVQNEGQFSISGSSEPLTGRFDFVVRNGEIRIGRGHYVLGEGGQPVEYAGEITLENGRLLEWTNGSGHYRPGAAFAGNAGLPVEGVFRQIHFLRMLGASQVPMFRKPF